MQVEELSEGDDIARARLLSVSPIAPCEGSHRRPGLDHFFFSVERYVRRVSR